MTLFFFTELNELVFSNRCQKFTSRKGASYFYITTFLLVSRIKRFHTNAQAPIKNSLSFQLSLRIYVFMQIRCAFLTFRNWIKESFDSSNLLILLDSSVYSSKILKRNRRCFQYHNFTHKNTSLLICLLGKIYWIMLFPTVCL